MANIEGESRHGNLSGVNLQAHEIKKSLKAERDSMLRFAASDEERDAIQSVFERKVELLLGRRQNGPTPESFSGSAKDTRREQIEARTRNLRAALDDIVSDWGLSKPKQGVSQRIEGWRAMDNWIANNNALKAARAELLDTIADIDPYKDISDARMADTLRRSGNRFSDLYQVNRRGLRATIDLAFSHWFWDHWKNVLLPKHGWQDIATPVVQEPVVEDEVDEVAVVDFGGDVKENFDSGAYKPMPVLPSARYDDLASQPKSDVVAPDEIKLSDVLAKLEEE